MTVNVKKDCFFNDLNYTHLLSSRVVRLTSGYATDDSLFQWKFLFLKYLIPFGTNGVVNEPQAKSKIEPTSGVLVHSYLGNQTLKARRAPGNSFDLGINTSVPKDLSGEILARNTAADFALYYTFL